MNVNYSKFGIKPLLKKITRKFAKVATILLKVFVLIALILCALWVILVFWVHLTNYSVVKWPVVKWIVTLTVAIFSLLFLVAYLRRFRYWQRWVASYAIFAVTVATWFALLPAKQDRAWKPEVAHSVTVTQDASHPNLWTLHNVRDFDWVRPEGFAPYEQPNEPYFHRIQSETNNEVVANERWTERTIDINQIEGVDIVNAYWMGEAVGHTLLSFRFKNERPLSFSFEIRKEEGETFSTIGGFFRQFEMALIASEERDIIYTRTNVRGEQVYIYPIEGITSEQMRQLFLQYMQSAQRLQQDAEWYNTLIDNCTTVIYDQAKKVANDTGERLPWDYRIIASGYIPNYLYDRGLLPKEKTWGVNDWYKNAHINPKVEDFGHDENQAGYQYSRVIRQGLPKPTAVQPTVVKDSNKE